MSARCRQTVCVYNVRYMCECELWARHGLQSPSVNCEHKAGVCRKLALITHIKCLIENKIDYRSVLSLSYQLELKL